MKRTKRVSCCAAVVWLALAVCPYGLPAQDDRGRSMGSKAIAVTIDDLPLNGPDIGEKRLRAMTKKLLSAIARNKVPVVGFVNESLLYVPGETDERIALLKDWVSAGVELGNHTFSHLNFKDVDLASYEEDLVRGETVTRMLMNPRKVRFFRHPYLQMGATDERERSFESFITGRGYRVAPVTIDILDWMFLSAYARARAAGNSTETKRVSAEYLRYASIKLDYCENLATRLFGRQIKQILLLHANELNADNLDRLAKLIGEKGYRYISLDEAIEDPVYGFPDKYKDTSDWLSNWAFSKGVKLDQPQPPEFIRKAFAEK